MHIYGPAHLHGAQPISPPHASKASKAASPDKPESVKDELQISDAARMVDQVNQVPEIRHEKVSQIRAQIAAGTYETDEKLEVALGRLLDEIG